jgi:hypothetical protein
VDQPRKPSLQQSDEFIPVELAITKDGRQQTRADSLTRVDGQNGAPAVGVTKEVVAALILATANPAFLSADRTSRPVMRGSRVTPR